MTFEEARDIARKAGYDVRWVAATDHPGHWLLKRRQPSDGSPPPHLPNRRLDERQLIEWAKDAEQALLGAE